jgi:hypothetical protein
MNMERDHETPLENKDQLTNRAKLLKVLSDQDGHLLNVAAICDAIASDARFNLWMSQMERRISIDEGFWMIDEYARLCEACSLAAIKWRETRSDSEFQYSMRSFSAQIQLLMNMGYKLKE